MTDLLIKENSPVKEALNKTVIDSSTAILRDTTAIKKYLGNYIDDEASQLTFT